MGELYARLRQHEAASLLAGSGAAVLHFATTAGPLGGGAWDVPERLDRPACSTRATPCWPCCATSAMPAFPPQTARGQVFFALPGLGILHYRLLAGLAPRPAGLRAVRGRLPQAMCRQDVAGIDIVHGAFGFLMMAAWPPLPPPGCAATCCPASRRATMPACWPTARAWPPACAGSCSPSRCCPAPSSSPCSARCRRRIGATATLLGAMCTLTIALLGASWLRRAPATCWPGRCWRRRRVPG
jgi:hypothetical protein